MTLPIAVTMVAFGLGFLLPRKPRTPALAPAEPAATETVPPDAGPSAWLTVASGRTSHLSDAAGSRPRSNVVLGD